MDERRGSAVILILVILCFVFISVPATNGEGEGQDQELRGNGRLAGALSKILGSGVFPFSSVSHVPTAAAPDAAISFWDRFKAMLPLSFHPNLDFRGSEEAIGSGEGGRAGAGEAVKGAAERSVEKSKEAVEDSAKSAAKIASEAVHKTAEGVKKSLSAKEEADSKGEL